MYIIRSEAGATAFPIEGLEDALASPHPHSRERAARLLLESLQLAEEEAARLRSQGYNPVIIRAGRQSTLRGWRVETGSRASRPRFGTRINTAGELHTTDAAWELPEGFVDTEADKHGPKVEVPASTLSPLCTNAEKAAWYAKYKPVDKTCLWQ